MLDAVAAAPRLCGRALLLPALPDAARALFQAAAAFTLRVTRHVLMISPRHYFRYAEMRRYACSYVFRATLYALRALR